MEPLPPVACPGNRFLLRATKYDGTAHWVQSFTVVSDDGNLLIARTRARTPIYTSRGEFRSPYESRVYFWRDRWYNVYRLSRPGCDVSSWYCNVTTPPEYDGAYMRYVDLDLDVTVKPNGWVQLVDQDEFEEHRHFYNYPGEVVANAEDAARELMELARSRGYPFDQG